MLRMTFPKAINKCLSINRVHFTILMLALNYVTVLLHVQHHTEMEPSSAQQQSSLQFPELATIYKYLVEVLRGVSLFIPGGSRELLEIQMKHNKTEECFNYADRIEGSISIQGEVVLCIYSF